MTLTLTTSSSARRWLGVSSVSQMTVSAPSAMTMSRSSIGLAGAEVGAGVGLGAALDEPGEHGRTRRLGEGRELAHRVVGVLGGALGPDGGQHHPLEPQLAVLDLGDVLELGGQPRDTAQRSAVLAVVLVAVVAGPVAGEESVLGRQRGGLQVEDV